MPTFHYADEPLPPPDELRRLLREAGERYDPLEELLTLERELAAREQRFNISSADFYQRFLAGQTEDDPEIIGWVGRFEAYLRLKQAIAESLKLVLANTPTTAAD
jgi:hypothetical protein